MDKEIKTKATSSDIAKPFSPKEVSYNDGNLYQLVGIAIPVPDGMRYMARTLNESVPDGMVFQPEDNRYNFICYSGKKLKDISYYKDSRFGVSVNVPWSFDLYAQVGALQDSDISSQTVERVLAYLAKQIGNSKIFDICIDKDEDNFVIAHGTLGRSTDKD